MNTSINTINTSLKYSIMDEFILSKPNLHNDVKLTTNIDDMGPFKNVVLKIMLFPKKKFLYIYPISTKSFFKSLTVTM